MEQNGYTEESYEAWQDNASEGVGMWRQGPGHWGMATAVD